MGEIEISLVSQPHYFSALLIGREERGAYQAQEFYYVPILGEIFSRACVNFPYGNNAGHGKWNRYNCPGSPSITHHPAETREKLPDKTKIFDAPEVVLLYVDRGKARVMRGEEFFKELWVGNVP